MAASIPAPRQPADIEAAILVQNAAIKAAVERHDPDDDVEAMRLHLIDLQDELSACPRPKRKPRVFR